MEALHVPPPVSTEVNGCNVGQMPSYNSAPTSKSATDGISAFPRFACAISIKIHN